MIGAFIGDSLGSFVEFEIGDCPNEILDKAMSMPGGGIWELKPGQVTDDSELAMCQLRGLLAGGGQFDHFHHALYYGSWINSKPFDIGNTTKNGLGPLATCLERPNPDLAYEAAKSGRGASSMSTGSMMRITPLAVWSRNLSTTDIEECVRLDVSMMHSRMDMWDLCSAYCIAIKTLINNANNTNRAKLAIDAVREYSERDMRSYLVAKWLDLAKSLVKKVREKEEETGEQNLFGNFVYNVY